MKIDGIISMREYGRQVFTDIVYEWEEDLSTMLGVPVIQWSRKHQLASGVLYHFPRLALVKDLVQNKRKRYLRFVMNALDDTPLFNHPSCVPIIIDFFVPEERMGDFIKIYDHCEYVFITSQQAYDVLSGHDLPFKIVHFPLTLSTRHIAPKGVKYEKKYTLALMGAQNADMLMTGFIERYAAEHPGFEYLVKGDGSNVYHTNSGKEECDASSRAGYFDLLRATKIVIYSTPGIRGRATAHGYDQVTPKFLEYLASHCQVIPRYSANSDTEYFNLEKYNPSVDTYEDFSKLMDYYLNTTVDTSRDTDYLKDHTSAKWSDIINNV